MKNNNDIFEILSENKKRRDAITRMLENIEEYPHLMFGKKKAEIGDFYSMEKKKQGAVSVIDLPVDLSLKELVIERLEKEHERLTNEFNSYTIKK